MFSQQHPMLMSRDGTTTTTNNNDEEEEEGDDDEEEDDVEVSPLYQAAIPTLRARPAQPSAREARFLQAVQVFAPPQHANGGGGVSRGGGAAASTATMQDGPPAAAGADAPNSLAATTQAFKVAYLGAAPRHRTALLACAVADLDQQLGVSLTQVGAAYMWMCVLAGTAQCLGSRPCVRLPLRCVPLIPARGAQDG